MLSIGMLVLCEEMSCSDLPKPFPKSIVAHRATVLSYNMALIITSIKLTNLRYFTIVCTHPDSATC